LELTTLIRITSQIALVAWCVAEAMVLIVSRGNKMPVAGVRWALVGLASFALWQTLSSFTIKDSGMMPREQLVAVFAGLELLTAVMAWGWLVASARQSFHFTLRVGKPGQTV